MKNFKKLFSMIFAIALASVAMSNVKADTVTCNNVKTEEELRNALSNEENGNCDVIVLGSDISLTNNIGIAKTVTIKGEGHKIYVADGNKDTFSSNQADRSLITATSGGKVTLENLTLEGAPKYGVQAFDGGEVTLDGVKIENCGFGGVLVNGGTVTVKDLTLGHNGAEDANNGIEISKGSSVSEENNPKLVMDGTLESSEPTGVVNVATNDAKLTEFTVENTENAENKLYVASNGVVVANQSGVVVYEGNGQLKTGISGKTVTENDESAPATHRVTIGFEGDTITFILEDEKTLADAEEIITAVKNGVEGKRFTKFITKAGKDFAEDTKITEDVELVALFEEIPAEVTPEEENPNTLDSAPAYLASGIVALTGVLALGYSIKKKLED